MPIPKMTVRYEDLRSTPLPSLLRMVRFLVPPSSLPSLSKIACALTGDRGRKELNTFDSWPRWNEAARAKVLEMTTEGWCRFGYEDDFRRRFDGSPSGIDCRSVAVERMRAHVDPEGSLWRRAKV